MTKGQEYSFVKGMVRKSHPDAYLNTREKKVTVKEYAPFEDEDSEFHKWKRWTVIYHGHKDVYFERHNAALNFAFYVARVGPEKVLEKI